MRALAACCSLAVLALSAWTAPAGSAERSCGREGRTVAANEQVRVYERHENYYGCAFERGRSHLLGSEHFDCVSAGGCDGIEEVRVAGRYAAFSYHANDGGASVTDTGSIVVRNLVTGGRPHSHDVGDFGRDATIGGFRVTPSGAVGYIVDRTPGQARDRLLEVWRMDSRGRRRLDRGRRIRAGSLRLVGRRFSWVAGGARLSATLR